MNFLQRPQTAWARRALFQVHLWTGVTVAAYVCLVGLTGAVLVFRPEMQKATFAEYFEVLRPAGRPDASPGTLVSNLQASYPLHQVLGIDYPTARRGTYLSYLMKGNQLVTTFSDPVSGEIIGEMPKRSWITQYSGRLLERRDQALQRMSAGDLVMKWIGPLHLGSFGGLGVKILWSALALSFPLLAVTGVIMWWRRVIS